MSEHLDVINTENGKYIGYLEKKLLWESTNASKCPNCDKIYDENDLLDGDMDISRTLCPHCKDCIHSVTRDLDCSSVHNDDCDDSCDEHCHSRGEVCGVIICCACGNEIEDESK